jgi:hypothetical protein
VFYKCYEAILISVIFSFESSSLHLFKDASTI